MNENNRDEEKVQKLKNMTQTLVNCFAKLAKLINYIIVHDRDR